MSQVTVRYWAGAQAAAGIASEELEARTVGELLDVATARHAALGPVLGLCAIVADGRRLDLQDDVPAGATVEVLPPFAGG
ncbi:MoaD/ThiS family protein [Dermatophilaceae bacterium Sec6.4]|nr:MoaD/ThiS family protein [Actinomycetota bacterium]